MPAEKRLRYAVYDPRRPILRRDIPLPSEWFVPSLASYVIQLYFGAEIIGRLPFMNGDEMVVQEDARVKGGLVNSPATRLWQREWAKRYPKTPGRMMPVIYGVALVFERDARLVIGA